MKGSQSDAELRMVKRIWPVFSWKRCMQCGQEFRGEWLWRAYSHQVGRCRFSRYPRELILCRHCVGDRRSAIEYFQSHWLPPKPDITPPPVKPPKAPEGGTGESPERTSTKVQVAIEGKVYAFEIDSQSMDELRAVVRPNARIVWPENEVIKERLL